MPKSSKRIKPSQIKVIRTKNKQKLDKDKQQPKKQQNKKNPKTKKNDNLSRLNIPLRIFNLAGVKKPAELANRHFLLSNFFFLVKVYTTQILIVGLTHSPSLLLLLLIVLELGYLAYNYACKYTLNLVKINPIFWVKVVRSLTLVLAFVVLIMLTNSNGSDNGEILVIFLIIASVALEYFLFVFLFLGGFFGCFGLDKRGN